MKSSLPLAAVVLIASAITLVGCGGGGGSNGSSGLPKDAVALVGTTPISRSDFDALLQASLTSLAAQKQSVPKAGTPAYDALRNQTLQELIQRVEFAQRAKTEFGISISDTAVDQRIKKIEQASFGGSDARFRKQIASQGFSYEQTRESIRADLVSEAIFDKVTKTTKVSQQDIATYYYRHLDDYRQPEHREVRDILVKTRAEADRIERDLASGGDFAALARRYSQDSWRKYGGRVPGGILRGRSAPEYEQAAFSLRRNEVSQPVRTDAGWYVIQALSGVERRPLPLARVRRSIEQELIVSKRNLAMAAWVAAVRKQFEPKIVYAKGFTPPAVAAVTTTG